MRIGLDIVEIDRVRRLAQRKKAFLRRVFSSEEMDYCAPKRRKWQHFAARFAAKEAVWKVLGRKGVSLRDISVRRGLDGRPRVFIRGRRAGNVELSLSHSRNYAMAVALAAPCGRIAR